MSANRPGRTPGNSNAPLLLMMGSVPLVVGLAVLAAILLSRMGLGLVVALGAPFVVSMVLIVAMGIYLARMSSPDKTDGKDRSGGR